METAEPLAPEPVAELSPMQKLLLVKKQAPASSPAVNAAPTGLAAPAIVAPAAFKKRKIVRISGSRYRKFQSCARLWALDEFMYWPIGSRGEGSGYAAETGDAMHYAWQCYLRTRDLSLAEATLWCRWPHDHPFAQNSRPYWRALDALRECCNHPISQYEMVYVDDPDNPGELKPAIELAVSLIVETPTLEIHYTGYLDAALVDPITGLPMVVDLKTTGDKENDWQVKYLNDTQVMGYAIILSALSHSGVMGKQVKGAYLGTFMRSSGEAWTTPLEKTFTRGDSLFFIHDLQLFAQQIALFQNAGRFPRSAASCKNWGRACRHLGQLCAYETLTDAQREIDGLKQVEDQRMTEFKPDFTIRYNSDLYKVEE